MKMRMEDVAPEFDDWKKEAAETIRGQAKSEWKEWAPQWLVPSLYQEDRPVRVEEVRRPNREEIEEKFVGLNRIVLEKLERDEISLEEAVEQEERLRQEKEEELRELEEWEARNSVGDEDEEEKEVETEVKGKGKGKGKEKRTPAKRQEKGKGKEKTKAPSPRKTSQRTKKSRPIIESEEEEEEEEKEDESGYEEEVEEGWRPTKGEKVSVSFYILLLFLISSSSVIGARRKT